MILEIIFVLFPFLTLDSVGRTAVFEEVNGRYVCDCLSSTRKDRIHYSVFLEYSEKDTVVNGLQYFSFESSALYGASGLRKQGNRIYILHNGTESIIADFGRKLNDSWMLNDSSIYRGYKMTYTARLYNKIYSDTVFSFSINSTRTSISHAPYLKQIDVCKSFGIVRLEFNQGDESFFCEPKIRKSQLKGKRKRLTKGKTQSTK